MLPVQLTADALAFVDGETDVALRGVCGMAATWRPLVQHSDSLIVSMGAVNAFAGAAGLFAEMLAELPSARSLPAECPAAFAPPAPDEGSICEAMKGEFASVRQAYRRSLLESISQEPLLGSLLTDPVATDARLAQRVASACGGRAREQLVSDQPLRLQVDAPQWEFACIANAVGCILADIAAPAYADYAQRGQDHLARIRLMATLLWLREHGSGSDPLAARLGSLPPALRSESRPVEASIDGSRLQVSLFWTHRHAHWQVPLAPYVSQAKANPPRPSFAKGGGGD